MESSQQVNNRSPNANHWEGLHDNLQERVLVSLPYRQIHRMRGASRQCRQIVNRLATGLTLTKATAGPTHTLNLAARLPNLRKLVIQDRSKADGDVQRHQWINDDSFTAMGLTHIFTAPGRTEPWHQLMHLDITQCRNLNMLVLAAIVKCAPNLQTLATWLPYNQHAAASQALAQLPNLHNLHLLPDSNAGQHAFLNAATIEPLLAMTALDTLTLCKANWQAVQAAAALTALTQLVLKTTLSSHNDSLSIPAEQPPSSYFPALAALSQLCALEIVDATVDFEVLLDTLQGVSSLRKLCLCSVKLAQPDDVAEMQLVSVSKLQQLIDISIHLHAQQDAFLHLDHAFLLIGCLQLPNLEKLDLAYAYLGHDAVAELLNQPAACAGSLHTFRAGDVSPVLLDSTLLKSLKLKDIHLDFGGIYFPELIGEATVRWLCKQTAMQSLTLFSETNSAMEFPLYIWQRVGSACSALTRLHMSFFDIMGPMVGLRHLTHLEELVLRLPFMEDPDADELVFMPKLRYVKLECCSRMTPLILHALAANLSITRMELDAACFSEETCAAARRLLRQDLEIERTVVERDWLQ